MDRPAIIFFGNERLATGVTTTAPTLRKLIDAGYNIVAVVSHNEATASRKQRQLEIAAVAEEHDIPVLLPSKPADILDQLKAYKPTVGVLVAYGKIVPQSVIDIFPKGIINIHPSLLPAHRGPTPVESVILAGETETGVSVMALAKEMDAGPVYAQERVTLPSDVSKQDAADTLLAKGSEMVLRHLPAILDGSLKPKAQDDTKATYDNLIGKDDGVLDFHKSAEQLEREIRAYIEWPKSRTVIGGKDVIITKAHVVPDTYDERLGHIEVLREAKSLMINCSQGYLAIDALKPAGKPEMPIAAFLAGYHP